MTSQLYHMLDICKEAPTDSKISKMTSYYNQYTLLKIDVQCIHFESKITNLCLQRKEAATKVTSLME